ncbi:RRP15-like protein [Petromyzon marinus]|uniref:RRP15-like protein n=1 Tax=Petromyzon marinus TaxID=7757 RepID=A0AAJ7SRZ1_PETMA|nr:RRP15-like protein [Petromyzon marinus]
MAVSTSTRSGVGNDPREPKPCSPDHQEEDNEELDQEEQIEEKVDQDNVDQEDAASDARSDAEDGGDADASDNEDESNDLETTDDGPSGWADAMAKILNKKIPQSKPAILLKSKAIEKATEEENEQREKLKKQIEKQQQWEEMCRMKPDPTKDRDRERNLQRVATRGVVTLFNAVRKHQKGMEKKVKEAGGLERKRAKVLSSVTKKDFISMLRGEEDATLTRSGPGRTAPQAGEQSGPSWNILREDFMMGAKMKDWDKESVSSASGGDGEPMDELDSDSD